MEVERGGIHHFHVLFFVQFSSGRGGAGEGGAHVFNQYFLFSVGRGKKGALVVATLSSLPLQYAKGGAASEAAVKILYTLHLYRSMSAVKQIGLPGWFPLVWEGSPISLWHGKKL